MYRTKEQPKELSIKELERVARKQVLPYQIQNRHRFTSGEDHWYWNARGDRKQFITKVTHRRPPEFLGLMLSDETRGKPVNAFILDGRWVARCECGGQEVVDSGDQLFVCLNPSCYNISTGHYPRKVNFPSKEQRKKLAEILLARPNPINRGWDRDGVFGKKETIEDLERENIDHGLTKVKVEEII